MDARVKEKFVSANGYEGDGPWWLEQVQHGAEFLQDAGHAPVAIWGQDSRVLWSSGEPFLLVGAEGVGKTTLGQQLALRRAGVGPPGLLELDVADDGARVLYVAADRPRQAQRSLARMVTEADGPKLRERLRVWKGPLPFDVAAEPAALLRMAQELEATTVILDSLKDVCADLERPEAGGRIREALQRLVGSDIEVLALHHPRKEGRDSKPAERLTDTYGARWLISGAGSVASLVGEAGGRVVELRHLKQPLETVGPLTVVHDHESGESRLHHARALHELIAGSADGLTATAAAIEQFGAARPTRAQTQRARRELEQLVADGRFERIEGGREVRYRASSSGGGA